MENIIIGSDKMKDMMLNNTNGNKQKGILFRIVSIFGLYEMKSEPPSVRPPRPRKPVRPLYPASKKKGVIEMIKCPKCGKVKPYTKYYKYNTGGNKLTYWCITCVEHYIENVSVGAN